MTSNSADTNFGIDRDEEDRLASRAAKGCRRSLQQLIAHTERALRLFILQASIDPSHVDDIFQTVWMQVIAKLPEFDPERGHAYSWICGFAHYTILQWHRNNTKYKGTITLGTDLELSGHQPSAFDLMHSLAPSGVAVQDPVAEIEALEKQAILMEVIVQVLATLNDIDTLIFRLKYDDGATNKVIGDRLGKSPRQIRNRLAKTIRAIQARLRESGIDPLMGDKT